MVHVRKISCSINANFGRRESRNLSDFSKISQVLDIQLSEKNTVKEQYLVILVNTQQSSLYSGSSPRCIENIAIESCKGVKFKGSIRKWELIAKEQGVGISGQKIVKRKQEDQGVPG